MCRTAQQCCICMCSLSVIVRKPGKGPVSSCSVQGTVQQCACVLAAHVHRNTWQGNGLCSSNTLLHHIFRQLLPGCCPLQQRCCVPCCACTGYRKSVLWFICYPASWETQCCCCCSCEREGVGIQVVPMHEFAPKRGNWCQLVAPTVGTGFIHSGQSTCNQVCASTAYCMLVSDINTFVVE